MNTKIISVISFSLNRELLITQIGWCDGAGKTSKTGASYLLIWILLGQGSTVLAVGGGYLDIFSHLSFRSSFFLSCLEAPLRPKQPTDIAEAVRSVSKQDNFQNVQQSIMNSLSPKRQNMFFFSNKYFEFFNRNFVPKVWY